MISLYRKLTSPSYHLTYLFSPSASSAIARATSCDFLQSKSVSLTLPENFFPQGYSSTQVGHIT